MVIIEKKILSIGLTRKNVDTKTKMKSLAKIIKALCKKEGYEAKDTILALPTTLHCHVPEDLVHPYPELGIKVMNMQDEIYKYDKYSLPTIILPSRSSSIDL